MSKELQVKNPKTIAFILMAGTFVGLFGETALNMALTNIMEQYAITAGIAQWLTTGYLLVLAILVPISALLMKWYTTRQLVIGGLIISLIGALLAAMSPTFGLLMVGRLVQAAGTGILIPVMTSVLLIIFPVHKRGMVMGIMGLVITLGPALGPTLSGVIISALSWPYIFWFSAILYGLLTLFAIAKIVNVTELTKPKVDVLSIVTSSLGFGGLIFALSFMAEASFMSAQVIIPLFIGVLSLLIFGRRQMTMEEPMVNLRVFKYPMFTLGTIMMFLSILIILSTGILLPLYLKGALLVSAAVAGLTLLPGNVVNVVMSPIVGGLFDRFGPRVFVITGSLIVLIGNLMFVMFISASAPVWQITLSFMVLFFGLTMVTMPSQTNALNQLPRKYYGDGSAAMNTLNQIAGAAGTAIAITLFTSGQGSFLAANPSAAEAVVIAEGIKYVFYFLAGISALCLVLSFFVKNREDSKEKTTATVQTKEVIE